MTSSLLELQNPKNIIMQTVRSFSKKFNQNQSILLGCGDDTDGQTDRQTHRHADTHTDTQTP